MTTEQLRRHIPVGCTVRTDTVAGDWTVIGHRRDMLHIQPVANTTTVSRGGTLLLNWQRVTTTIYPR